MGFDKPDLGFVRAPRRAVVAGGVLPAGGPCRPWRRRTPTCCCCPAPRTATSGSTSPPRPCPTEEQAAARARGAAERRADVDAGAGGAASTSAAPRWSCCSRCSTWTAPCERVQGGWVATGQPWTYDAERYARIAAARVAEQQHMIEYEQHRRLPDGVPAARASTTRRRAPCGRCDNCAGGWYPTDIAEGAAASAAAVARPGRRRRSSRGRSGRAGADRLGRAGARASIAAGERAPRAGRSPGSPTSAGADALRELFARRRAGRAGHRRRCSTACVRVLARVGLGRAARSAVVALPSRRAVRCSSTRSRAGSPRSAGCRTSARSTLGTAVRPGGPGGNSAFRLAGVWDRFDALGARRSPGRAGAAGRRPRRQPLDPDRRRPRAAAGRGAGRAAVRAGAARLSQSALVARPTPACDSRATARSVVGAATAAVRSSSTVAREARRPRVRRGRRDAVVRGEADDVDVRDARLRQDLRERGAGPPDDVALEPGVVLAALALADVHGVGRQPQVGVVRGPGGVGDAVHRPGGHVVRVGADGEVAVVGVRQRCVPVPRRDDQCIPVGLLREEAGDGACDGGAAVDGQRAALAEVVLDVDDDQCPGAHAPIMRARRQDVAPQV